MFKQSNIKRTAILKTLFSGKLIIFLIFFNSLDVMQEVTDIDIASLKYARWENGLIAGNKSMVGR